MWYLNCVLKGEWTSDKRTCGLGKRALWLERLAEKGPRGGRRETIWQEPEGI